MVLSVNFLDINQHDDLRIIIDEFSKTIVYKEEKWLNPNERAFVKVFDDGLATYGLEMQHDPMHGNQRYVWSSNPGFINQTFSLTGTSWELARWDCGAGKLDECAFAMGITVKLAAALAEANQDKLHYGLIQFLYDHCGRKIEIVAPKDGMQITHEAHHLLRDEGGYDLFFVEESGCWVECGELSKFCLQKYGMWSRNDYLGKVI